MTATLPDWIAIDQAVGDLSALIPELQVYAQFANHWREIGAEVWKVGADAPVDSPVGLAVYLAGKLDAPEIAAIFTGLGLDSLRHDLAGLGARFTDPAAPWAKLLQPCDAFAESYGEPPADGGVLDDGDNPGLVALKIPKLDADSGAGLGKGSLTFGITAAAGLECEAGAVWPFRADAVTPGLLRLGASGQVTAKAGFALPFGQIGSGNANAAAAAAARLDFFYRPARAQAPFAEALVPALTGIPNPLNLSDINHAVELAGLEGIILAADGSASAGLGVTLGASYDVPDVAAITAGLVAELSFKRSAHWLLSLRRAADGLDFVLSRNLSRERNWSVGVDLAVDYSALARRVHDVLVKADGLAQPLLAQVRPFLSPGTYIAEHAKSLLDAAAASIVAEPELRAAFDADIGLALGTGESSDLALGAYVRNRIVALAASHAGGVLADAEQWARGIAEGLAGKFPALADVALADKLVARIKPLLADVKKQFGDLVDDLVKTDGLVGELTAAGVKLSSLEAKADEQLTAVRRIVEEFDKFSRLLIDQTGAAVEHRLQARFGWSGSDSNGLQYELVGTFADTNLENAALWRSLVTGQLEPFQRILADPAKAPPGLKLDPQSSMTRFAGLHRGFSLEVVVLGLSVSISSIVEGKARITVSAGGDVSVAAEGSASRSVDGFDEGRAASFVTTWDLALHKSATALGEQRNMTVALAFDHSDKDLNVGEVKGFFAGLANQGLVESSRVTRALEVYQEWRNSVLPGKNVQGRIDVSMALTGTAVSRMVALGRLAGVKGSTRQFELFACAAKAMAAAGVTDQHAIDRDCKKARVEFKQLAKVDDPWRIMYGLQNVDLTPPETAGYRGYVYSAFAPLIPRSLAFTRLLVTMAKIYEAIPVGASLPGPQWSEKDYAQAEKLMASDARMWLRLNQKFVFWFKDGLHPAMVAFLRLLADMNRPLSFDGDPFAELGLYADTAASSALFAITMRQGKDRKPVAI